MGDLLEVIARTADGAFAIDSDQRIILWNEAAERLLGYTAEEVLGHPCFEVVAGKDRFGLPRCAMGCQEVTTAKEGGLISTYEMVTRHKNGHEVWLNVSILVVPGSVPEGCAVVHLFRGINEQHQLEQFVEQLMTSVAKLPRLHSQQGGLTVGQDSASMVWPTLTSREMEVLRLLASGASTLAMAERLFISRSTVRNHIQNILNKLNVHSRLEAVALGFKHRLI